MRRRNCRQHLNCLAIGMLMSKSTGLMSTAVTRKSMTPTIDTASPAKITKIIRMKFRASAAAA